MRVEMDLRSLPPLRILEYLVEAGGTRTEGEVVEGSGWRAELLTMPPVQVHFITIPRHLLVLEGEPEAVETLHAFMRRKTMRGGG